MIRADMKAARAAWIAEGTTPKERAKRAESYFLVAVDVEGRRIDFRALHTTCGTWLDQVGIAPSVAKRVTGHASEQALEKYYHRATAQQTRRAIEALPSIDLRAMGTDDSSATPSSTPRNAGTKRCNAMQRNATKWMARREAVPDVSPCLARRNTKRREEMRGVAKARVTEFEPATSVL